MKIIMILSLLITGRALSKDTCSRVCTVNFQETLVDLNSIQKGEGLRSYLEKDPEALRLLGNYQDGTKMRWYSAALGTIGSGLILGGVLSNGESNRRKTLVISGGVVILVNFLVAKTMQASNEQNLQNAVDEYNKRNLPKIYFSPDKSRGKSEDIISGFQMGLEKTWGY